MNKQELLSAMAEKSGLTKKDSEAALAAFIETVQDLSRRVKKFS